jgi:TolA-binding protein
MTAGSIVKLSISLLTKTIDRRKRYKIFDRSQLAVDKRKGRILFGVPILILAAALMAWACGWGFFSDHTVRFNSTRSGRGFYRLPPLPFMIDEKTGKELTVAEIEESQMGGDEIFENTASDTTAKDLISENPDDIRAQVRDAIEKENLPLVKVLLAKYLKVTEIKMINEQPERQEHRNSAYDLLDAISALAEGATEGAVLEYLKARLTFDDSLELSDEQVNKGLADKHLRDNWDYLRAALSYATDKDDTLEVFRSHVTKYPHSEKNEAAMYMTAKLTMQTSSSFLNAKCDIADSTADDEESDDPDNKERCQDDNWHDAVKAFKALLSKYPNGRYCNDAKGWLAYLYLRGGEGALSLAEYYRLLGNPTDRNARLGAKRSLQMIGHEQDDETLDKVEALISGDADAAMAYAYHRIYNFATDLTYEHYWPSTDETERLVSTNKGTHELLRVARFATAMINRYPQAKISGGFVLRVSEAQLELQNFSEALALARKALALGLTGELRTQALWVKGSSEHHEKDYASARRTFGQLISEFPNGKLTEGARRLIAMTAEDQNDLETALEQYIALNYQTDVAYYVDVLLPTDRLARFIDTHESLPQHSYLLYALGVRYMRDKRWEEARSALRQVRTDKVTPEIYSYDDSSLPSFAKIPDYNWGEKTKIQNNWILQDLKTIESLERLEKEVSAAVGDEAKAEAMYQLASYQYDASALLFYNPAAWGGARYQLLSDLYDSDRMRLPGESQILFEHFQSHDTLARAIPIYLDVVKQFPDTKAAKDALYSAAVSHDRLSDLNPFWREIYKAKLFAGPEMITYTDVKRSYPRYQLPRSTYGWQPSKRTVNGGPAWAPPQKPLPKLTLTQRMEHKFAKIYSLSKTRIGTITSSAAGAANTFLSGIFDGLLIVVATMLLGYALLLSVHFPIKSSRATINTASLEAPLRISSNDEKSFVEKVIDDG